MEKNYIAIEDNNHQSLTTNNQNPLEDLIESKDSQQSETNINYLSYNSEFELMKSNYEAKLDSLVKAGYKDYKSEETSIAQLVIRYTNEAVKLEKEVNSKFSTLLDDMENEIKTKN